VEVSIQRGAKRVHVDLPSSVQGRGIGPNCAKLLIGQSESNVAEDKPYLCDFESEREWRC
jgi:hypothetical protein